MAINKVIKVKNNTELLSFIINSTPELASEIDLPVQGKSIKPIGKIIMDNQRYKNAFLNTLNVIGLTIIDRNYWDNPWEVFANRGNLPMGQHVRELAVDIADVFDFKKFEDSPDNFLKNVVPNVYNYLHEINYQKFYKTTTSDVDIRMAFDTENGLFDLIEKIIASLYEGYKYDKYIADKYMLCRRIVDGTITSIKIENYATLTPRQRVSKLKNISNLMTFRSPNYNPAGIRISTNFDNQIAIINTDFEADMSTEVLATSFFTNEAEMKSRSALIDGFGNHDDARLKELFGNDYIPFTKPELDKLSKIPAVIIDDEFFQDYSYSLDTEADTKYTTLENPESLKRNHWLHTWKVLSTSPFKNAVVFVIDEPKVKTVTVAPNALNITAGIDVQLNVSVDTEGFANKAVIWKVKQDPETVENKKVSVSLSGKVIIPADHKKSVASDNASKVIISAVSVFDNTKSGDVTITVL